MDLKNLDRNEVYCWGYMLMIWPLLCYFVFTSKYSVEFFTTNVFNAIGAIVFVIGLGAAFYAAFEYFSPVGTFKGESREEWPIPGKEPVSEDAKIVKEVVEK